MRKKWKRLNIVEAMEKIGKDALERNPASKIKRLGGDIKMKQTKK